MRWVLLLFAAFWCRTTCAQSEVRVRLFANKTVPDAQVRMMQGRYAWLAVTSDGTCVDTIADAFAGFSGVHRILPVENELKLYRKSRYLGQYARLLLMPKTDTAHYLIRGTGPERMYEGVLEIRVHEGNLLLIGEVGLPSYIAGVVESEGGHSPQFEYFKAQAVIARTWLLRNWDKHIEKGYNVTDDVSSQAYYSMAYLQYSDLIRDAVKETGDSVLVDTSGKAILAVYHANSGGITSNSEDVWLEELDYLRSVQDSFSLMGSKSQWERRVNKSEFLSYVAERVGASVGDRHFRQTLLNYVPRGRESHFSYNGRKVKWTAIRMRFQLRSTWFGIEDRGNELLLRGFGFGHGVGLSQEGAMIMAERGYCYDDILAFYFRHTRLMSMSDFAE